MNILFGGSGQLGSEILKQLKSKPNCIVRVFKWSELQFLDANSLQTLFQDLHPAEQHNFIFSNGVTNSKAGKVQLQFSNFEFVKNVMSATQHLPLARAITFGTIFERFPSACETNDYLNSKLKLSKWVEEQEQSHVKHLHFRLHTLYGGKVPDHMFLGQIFQAIKNKAEFKMSSGEQMREYHHVEDIAETVTKFILMKDWPTLPAGPIEINSGQPIKLNEIATKVFTAFDQIELLKIGVFTTPTGENLEQKFTPSPKEFSTHFRDPSIHIVTWIKELLRGVRN